ncbi:TRAP transporter substrate-binding protein [Rhodovibrio salinarum]|uniref:C4-dicarboxylate ABC transporter substrate-binding protein n=1 Tax=Rhodovibrio salinarum TaxID=1087 RepID=A0A934QL93_9PROT|nr:TRAP transporter substrate-binding protein [Rhodovibrio salinarum]MBK1698822.1 C4-dicarboxylate ABC transporter substrate-binding protein [Rhodovibrio salinarum]
MSRIRTLSLAAVAAAGLSVGAQGAAAAEWNMPTPYPAGNFHTQNIQEFANDVDEMTDGALTITVHPAGALFKHPEIKNAVRSRQVQAGEFLLSRLANEDAVFQVDSVPFLATDYTQAQQLWNASKPIIADKLAEQNLKVLFTVPWPPQGLYTKKKIEDMSDLKGISFRAYNSATERLAQLADMVPTQVEVPDVAQAFATGRVDAMMTSPSTGVNTKAWDFTNHFYHLQAWLPKNIVVVNARVFQSLDEETRQAVLDAADKAMDRGWEMSKKETTAQMDKLEANGMAVHREPAEALTQGFQKIGQTMAKEWQEEAGEDGAQILDAYRETN